MALRFTSRILSLACFFLMTQESPAPIVEEAVA
jgi:hypothetical protein